MIYVISRRTCFLLLHSVLRASSGARILWMRRKTLGLLSRSTSRDFRHLVKVLFYISLNCYTNLYNLISGDIPFEDLSTAETVKDSSLASTPSEKKTSIMGTISGDFNHSFDSYGVNILLSKGIKMKKRSGLLGIFGQNKVETTISSLVLSPWSHMNPYLAWKGGQID